MAKILDEYRIEIEQSDKPGSIIDLRDLKSIDISMLKNKIKEFAKNDDNFIRIINEKVSNIANSKNLEINNLNNKIKNIEDEYKRKIESEITKIKLKNDLDLKDYDTKIKLINQAHISEIEDNLNSLELQFEKERNDLNLTIKNLENKLENRTTINSANLGRSLESQIDNNLNNYYQDYDNIIVKFQPKPIQNTKPDWLIEFKYEKISKRIVIDSKSEDPASKVRNKNSKYFEKLEKDRLNNEATFAILVTELEADQNFVIRKAPDYPFIIMCRPSALIELLRILKIALDSEVNLDLNSNDSSKKLVNIVEKVLPLYINTIDKSTQEILKKAETIKNSALNIEKEVNKIMKSTFNDLSDLLKG
ncbi:MAG: DUF2130 domain-containing protein [Mycoplasmataceae bacterium]|nr:DUF2130 domain-containing protein [Mycoplasmataceae bacterium]